MSLDISDPKELVKRYLESNSATEEAVLLDAIKKIIVKSHFYGFMFILTLTALEYSLTIVMGLNGMFSFYNSYIDIFFNILQLLIGILVTLNMSKLYSHNYFLESLIFIKPYFSRTL